MAGRNKEPIALLDAKGKSKHITKEERERRLAEEVKVDLIDVRAPAYLTGTLVDQFDDLARKLLHIGIFTELDVDRLAMYVMSRQQYVASTAMLTKATKDGDLSEMRRIALIQDKAFNQCRACASDLGLSITSRCKLVVPQIEVKAQERPGNKFAKFLGGA